VENVGQSYRDRIADYAEKRKRVEGITYKQTAEDLGISTSTLYRYRTSKRKYRTTPSKQTVDKMKRGGRLTNRERHLSETVTEKSQEIAQDSILEDIPRDPEMGGIESGFPDPVSYNKFIDFSDEIITEGTGSLYSLGSAFANNEDWVQGLAEEMEEGRPLRVQVFEYEAPTGERVITMYPTEAGDYQGSTTFDIYPEDLENFDADTLAEIFWEFMYSKTEE